MESDEEAIPPSVEEALSLPLQVIEPVVQPSLSASSTVTAEMGGTVRLDVPAGNGVDSWSATLTVPPSAVDTDVVVTLMNVASVGESDAASGWRGVEIQPSGLIFPDGAFPRLTFTGVPADFLTTALGWDAEGVVETAAVLEETDGSVSIGVRHFSGYGGGDLLGPEAIVGTAQAALKSTLADAMAEARVAHELGSDDADEVTQRGFEAANAAIDKYVETELTPMLASGARRCGAAGRRAVDAWFWATTQKQLYGGDPLPGLLLKPVIAKQFDCARQACEERQDPASAGLFWWALRIGLTISDSIDDSAEADLIEEGFDILRRCATWRFAASGGVRGVDILSTGGLWEGFHANGLVPGEGEAVVPMRVTSNTLDVIGPFIRGMRVAIAGQTSAADVECTGSDYGRSAMRVTLSSYRDTTNGANAEFPEVELVPFVTSASTTCGDSQTQESTPVFFGLAVVPVVGLEGLTFDGTSFSHRFTEYDRVGESYAYGEVADLPTFGGTLWLTITLQPAWVLGDPPLPPDTSGLVDVAQRTAEVQALTSGG